MQRRTLVLMLLLAVAVAVTGAWLVLNRSGAAGATAARDSATEVPVAPFRNIEVQGFADVTLVEGSTESVAVASLPKGATPLTFEVSNGTLRIAANESRRWWQRFGSGASRIPRVTVTLRTLDTLQLGGAVRVRAASLRTPTLAVTAAGAASIRVENLQTDELKLSGAGAVKADFAGRAREQTIALAGAGVFRGADLAGENVRVAVTGAGKAAVRAARTLDVAISGAGSVEYSGEPKVTQEISGAGKIRRRSAGGDDAVRVRTAGGFPGQPPGSRPASESDVSAAAVPRPRESSRA